MTNQSDVFENRDNSGTPELVETPEQWSERRSDILQRMQRVMGPLPESMSETPLDIKVLSSEKLPDFERRKISYVAEPGDRVPAYLLIPKKLTSPSPAVLCLHQTTNIGKDEPAGVGGLPALQYAAHLAQRGYVTLAPDYPLHRPSLTDREYQTDPYARGYESATMKGVHNHRRAIDVLQSLDEVDANCIGCIGHSLGGHNTIILGAFDERIKAMVSNCGFNSCHKYRGGDLTDWSHRGYMPLIKSTFGSRAENMPFDFPEVIAALAPRPFLAIAPLHDDDMEVEGVPECIAAAQEIYDLLNASDKLAVSYPNCEHDFPAESRSLAYDWLDRWLQ